MDGASVFQVDDRHRVGLVNNKRDTGGKLKASDALMRISTAFSDLVVLTALMPAVAGAATTFREI